MKSLNKLLSQEVKGSFPSEEAFEKYLQVLQVYWSGDAEESLKLVASEIHKSEGKEIDAIYYRLWLEQLAETKDVASLSYLQRHFVRMSGTSFLSDETLKAFRGLIHLELDEVKFSNHLYELLKNEKKNTYALEFCQKFESRFADEGSEEIHLLDSSEVILDFFSWRSLSQSLLVSGKESSLEKVLTYVDSSYDKSPLAREFSYYKHIDLSSFEEAGSEAQSLANDYSQKSEYSFMEAYALSCAGRYKDSNIILEKLLKTSGTKDADVFSLLGQNSYQLSFGDIQSEYWEKAIDCFLKAEALLSQKGISTKDILLNLSLMQRREAELSGSLNEERKSYHYWLVNLTARDFSSLVSMNKKDLGYQFHKMSASAREGDLIFFVSNANNSSKSHLGAVYEVLSSPVWEHQNGYQTMLELVKRFDKPVPLSMNFSVENGSSFLNAKKETSREPIKGNYLLSGKGLSQISEDIFQHLEDKKLKTFFETLILKKA